MATTITIAPVTRIEGHAKVTIQLDERGNVRDTTVNVVELRGFEKFCLGRPAEEMPRITTSICGVCPWSHHLASAKACDAVFGVTPPPAGKKLRDLCNSIAFCEEHILHFYFLAGADFVMGPDADPSVRNVIGIARANPELGKQVVRARHLGARMLNVVSGKSIHPVTAVPGGFSKPLTEDERKACLPLAQEVLRFAKFSIAFAKQSVFPKYLDTVKTLGVIRTGFLGTVDANVPLAQAELEEFRAAFGRPAQLTLLYHWARLIELLYHAEHAVELLNDPEITSRETRVAARPRAARGIGCVEAPRGTLIHDYQTDADGMLTDVNLIVGTTHNNAPINMSVKQAATALIRDGAYDQALLDKVEMAIRAYDPCLSCATHKFDGTLAVRIGLVDARGEEIAVLRN